MKSSVLGEYIVRGLGLMARGCVGVSSLAFDPSAGDESADPASRSGRWVLSSFVHRELWERLCAERLPLAVRLADVAMDGAGSHVVLQLTAPGWLHQIVLPRCAEEVQRWLEDVAQQGSVLLALRYLGASPGAVLGLELKPGAFLAIEPGDGSVKGLGDYLAVVCALATTVEGRWCVRDAVADGRAPRESFAPLLPRVLEPKRSAFEALLNEVGKRP